MAKSSLKHAEREIRALRLRVDGAEQVQRILYQVQVEQLAQAEALRKLADKVAHAARFGTPKLLATRVDALFDLLQEMEPFHKTPRRKLPPLLQKFDREMRR